ncbi:MAG: hypothetical protein M1820_000900 [Bogoriella megaspora]|nr:MAG: hypothetical protein M1820_000900 [Bogoriella megaspora]
MRALISGIGRPITSSSTRLLCRFRHQTQIAQASTNASQTEVESARNYCSSLLKTYDSPSYLLQAFIPSSAQDAYLAIRAFNVDVARVADATSNPTVGTMRMQFWRDAITKALSGNPPKEPVAVLLAKAQDDLHQRSDGKARLSKGWFHRIISTREQHLANQPFPTLGDLENYAENTYSTLLYLTLSSLPLASITADHLASHIGKASGIAAVLRGLPLIAFPPPPNKHSNQAALGGSLGGSRQGAVLLPLDVMADTGVREEDVLRQGAEAHGLRDAIFTVATRANDHILTARQMLKNLRAGQDVGHEYEHQHDDGRNYDMNGPADSGTSTSNAEVARAFGVLLHAIPTISWLDRLEQVDFDAFAPSLRKADWKLPYKAYWAHTRRKI